MNKFNFITKQLDLIEIEKNAEIDESKYLIDLYFILNNFFKMLFFK